MARRKLVVQAVVLAVLALAAVNPASSQEREAPTLFDSVSQLRRSSLEEEARVIGFVSAERRVASRSFKGYYITDRFGSSILVRTTSPLPEVLTRLTVTGVLLRDIDTRELYLAETARSLQPEITRQPEVSTQVRTGKIRTDEEVLGEESAGKRALEGAGSVGVASAKAAETAAPPASADPSFWNQVQSAPGIVLGAGGALLLAVAAGLFMRSGNRPASPPMPAAWGPQGAGASQASPSPFAARGPSELQATVSSSTASGADDYKTVRVFKTTRLLPVTLEVMNGDQVIERIPLYDTGQGAIDIGRDAPGETSGVRIKDPSNTLSRRQARIEVDQSRHEVYVANLASEGSNSTVVDNRRLKEGERVEVRNGARIQMGAVHARISVAW